MFFRRKRKRQLQIEQAVRDLADLLLAGQSETFRQKAKELTSTLTLSINDLNTLQKLFHNPPEKSDSYDPSKHGLSAWLSICQFAIFELIYHMGEMALPFIRRIAWGEYDWTQGNAIELLIRFASEGVQSNEIIKEIKEKFPRIRYEAQLYTIKPLLNRLENNQTLQDVFDQLMEIDDFKEVYDELTAK